MLLAVPLTQVLYPVALVRALVARRTTWRNVVYEIGPGRAIRRLNDPPFAEHPVVPDSEHSL
jgi:hypothetical protein